MDATAQSAAPRLRRPAHARRLLGVLIALVLLALPADALADAGGVPDRHAIAAQLGNDARQSLDAPPVDPLPPADPAPVDPVPATEPVPASDPAPSADPPPADPVPVDPAPADPVPADDPPPADPVPVDPVSVDPPPADPVVVVDPAPVDPVVLDDPAPADTREARSSPEIESAASEPSPPAPAAPAVAPPSTTAPEPKPEPEAAALGTTEELLASLGIVQAAPAVADLAAAVAAAAPQSCASAIPVGVAASPEAVSALAEQEALQRHASEDEPPQVRGPPAPFDAPSSPVAATNGAPAGATSGQGGDDGCALAADALALELSGVELLVAPQRFACTASAPAGLAARAPPVV